MYEPKNNRAQKNQEAILAFMAKKLQEGLNTDEIYTAVHAKWNYSKKYLLNLAPIHAAQALIDKEQPASQEAAA